ncbi:hypothetical protein HHTV1_70 [Haloarcula hispanica tailed virus 1]|uniref:Uncharacterized protein n=1 Tax=Haloarcula hispanica tailed virus 1 TaxID=1273750 RepID=R4T6J7_9CAUD|nr:hypothetical protein M198_gp71 [Haloarcula hispanica tailed virus 1]AGM11324.1 hypothetical protein HHTV1_70 [Haloarcula hispanica tailed virus 1]
MKIHQDAFRVAADIVEQLEQIGFTVTLGHIEGHPGAADHYLLNLDATADHIESQQGLQQVLDQIGSDHADELHVAAPEAPDLGGPDGVFWELEAMIRIRESLDR